MRYGLDDCNPPTAGVLAFVCRPPLVVLLGEDGFQDHSSVERTFVRLLDWRNMEADAPRIGPGPADAPTISMAALGGVPAPPLRAPLEPGQAFGSRYHIIRLLGVGGMGAVYQAWDAELGVAVAIKVIRPDVMADARTAAEVERRFKRELLLARQVTHKNVVRIFDLGTIGGIKYITMSYVEGVDLATLIRREGRQPIRDVLRIARSVVSALVSAHAAGVVHRDLKPANIVVQRDGEALVMDFGIALSTGDAAPAGAAYTAPGRFAGAVTRYSAASAIETIVGTPDYMAPEQANGGPIDQRADIYAYGLILYDALIGRRRDRLSENPLEDLQQRMLAAPPPVRSISPAVPEAVDALVSRCVDPDPAKRYQTSEEVAAALARLDAEGNLIPELRQLTPRIMVAAALLVAALLVGTYVVTRRAVETPAAPPRVSVVIADVDNTIGDAAFD